MGKITRCGITGLLLILMFCNTAWTAEETGAAKKSAKNDMAKQQILLDADNVRYNEESGIVEAEGNVFIRNWQFSLRAPYVNYNTETQQLKALSDAGNNVLFISQNERLIGNSLDYNVGTKRGLYTNVTGRSGEMYLKGENIQLMPINDAVVDKVVNRKQVSAKSLETKDVIAKWNNISATSCDFAKPHYKLKTKSAVIIPGKKILLKKPSLYFDEHLVFKYPFDYAAKFGLKNKIMPMLDYSSDKGVGIGIQGPLDFGKQGILDTKFVYWTKDYFEADFKYERDFFIDGLSIYGRINREYNRDDDDIQWRPEWGFKYSKNGWDGRVCFAERQIIKTEKVPGITHRYNVTKKPEVYIDTPWLFDKFKPGKIKAGIVYGRYSDDSTIEQIERAGGKVEFRSNFDDVRLLNYFVPFYGARYKYYKYYDDRGNSQKIGDVWAGVKYRIGAFDFSTRYYQRWVNGLSPMEFDRYEDNKSIYQSLEFPLPFGNKVGKWKISAATEYDLENSRFATLYYALSYNKHCYTWMLWGKKEFFGTESELGLTFYINAFPDRQLNIGSGVTDEDRELMNGEY